MHLSSYKWAPKLLQKWVTFSKDEVLKLAPIFASVENCFNLILFVYSQLDRRGRWRMSFWKLGCWMRFKERHENTI
jgi:hypothetical protein